MSFRLFEDDPFFSSPPSMFGRSSFPMLGFPGDGQQPERNHGNRRHNRQVAPTDPFSMMSQMDQMMNEAFSRHHQMMSHSFGNMGDPGRGRHHRSMDIATGGHPGHFHSSSSVMTFSNTSGGTPQFYHATSSETRGPGGVRETRKTEADSRTGKKKMAIGHHIGDRSHTIEKRQDVRTKEMEEHQQFVNLAEDDAEHFDREWTDRTRSFRHQPGLHRDRLAGRRHGLPPVDLPPPGHRPDQGGRVTRSRSPERLRRDPIDVDALPTHSESEAQRRKEYLKRDKRVKF